MTKVSVNASSPDPLYRQVIDHIRRDIESGEYKVGEKIPTESELCEKYTVSRITVRKAVESLSEEGLLTRKQGKGTFVSAPYIPHMNLKQVNSFHEACAKLGKMPSTKVVSARSVLASGKDCKELSIKAGSHCIETVRLRYADRVPVMLETNRFSMAYSYLLDSDLSGSLYNMLREYGIEAAAASHDVSLHYADENEAEMMGILIGDPLILLHEVVYDQKGRPIHKSDQFIRGEIFTLRL